MYTYILLYYNILLGHAMFDFRNINLFYTYSHLKVGRIIHELQNIRDLLFNRQS